MDYTRLPISLINKYIWDLAKGDVNGEDYSSIWDTTGYTYQPFFPITESLGADTERTPFIIYDFLFSPKNNTQWFINQEKSVYTIVGEFPQIYYVRNFIQDALKKFDSSAQEVNNYLGNSDIHFKYIKCEQSNFILDEKRIDSFKPKFVTSLILTYEYTKE